jgi:hypothetical protein
LIVSSCPGQDGLRPSGLPVRETRAHFTVLVRRASRSDRVTCRDHAEPPKDLDEQVAKVKAVQREKPVSDEMKGRSNARSLSSDMPVRLTFGDLSLNLPFRDLQQEPRQLLGPLLQPAQREVRPSPTHTRRAVQILTCWFLSRSGQLLQGPQVAQARVPRAHGPHKRGRQSRIPLATVLEPESDLLTSFHRLDRERLSRSAAYVVSAMSVVCSRLD